MPIALSNVHMSASAVYVWPCPMTWPATARKAKDDRP
jgi:hypothetical protein